MTKNYQINPGELDKRIAIVQKTATQDDAGYDGAETDADVWTCWAGFHRKSGTETEKNRADFTEIRVRFLIRTPPVEINRKMWVRYDGQLYAIEYVNDYDDAGQYTEIWAVLRTDGTAQPPEPETPPAEEPGTGNTAAADPEAEPEPGTSDTEEVAG